jgi:ADP-heptose:LPS heptosyltransferase
MNYESRMLRYDATKSNILIIKTGGLGSIVRATPLTRVLKEQYPESTITWFTDTRAAPLLQNVPSIDRIMTDEGLEYLSLLTQEFDLLINFDSRLVSCLALASIVNAKRKVGFALDKNGKFFALSNDSLMLMKMQTDDYYRARVNRKPMQQLFIEAAGFKWEQQEYDLITNSDDDNWAVSLLARWGVEHKRHYKLLGLNIGSRLRTDVKRWPIENFFELSKRFADTHNEWKIVVLWGPDDVDLVEKMRELQASRRIENLIIAECTYSLSQLISLVNLIPITVSADTFVAHIVIGLKKRLILLSGPQPPQENHLYGRGEKIYLDLPCSPCLAYKEHQCFNHDKLACMQHISISQVQKTIENQIREIDAL